MELSAAIVGCGPRGVDHGSVLGEVEGISLVGVCDPFRPAQVTDSDDTRELALPVSSLAFRRVDGRR